MIEVHVRQKHVVDVADIEVLLAKRIDQERHAVIDAGIHERGSSALDD